LVAGGADFVDAFLGDAFSGDAFSGVDDRSATAGGSGVSSRREKYANKAPKRITAKAMIIVLRTPYLQTRG
jgi:hypothetical protein